jgi:hypothetical protein
LETSPTSRPRLHATPAAAIPWRCSFVERAQCAFGQRLSLPSLIAYRGFQLVEQAEVRVHRLEGRGSASWVPVQRAEHRVGENHRILTSDQPRG